MSDVPLSARMRPAPFPFDMLVDDYERYRSGYAVEVYEAVRAAGVGLGTRVLDVGCGTGLAAAAFLDAGACMTGIDIAPQMLVRARKHLPTVRFDLGAAEELPYADAAFDAVICAQAFHWFERDRALAEMARVVRPGGLVAIWWKIIMRGDALRIFRAEAARTLGLEIGKEILGESFAEFEGDLLDISGSG